jgi:hemolysin activation/secretion protein
MPMWGRVWTRALSAGTLRCALLLAALLLGAPAALAQTIPPAVDPGVIQRRFEVTPPAPRPPAPPAVVPDLAPGVVPPGAEEMRFTLEEVRLEGGTVYDEAELRPLWAELLGREIALSQIFAVADAITRRYRNDGYILSRALVPAQTISDGRIRIRIVEGYVDRVIIEGEPVPEAHIRALADRIAAARPLRNDVLERNLLLLNELPGLAVDSVLRPSPDVPGAAELVLLTSLRRYSADLGLSNRGNRYTGPLELSAGLQGNSLLGRYDRTQLRGVVNPVSPEQLLVAVLEHSQPLGTNGTRLTAFGAAVWTEPGSLDDGDEVEGESQSLSLAISHPVILTRQQRLELRAELGLLNSDTDVSNPDPDIDPDDDAKDRIRTLRLGGSWDYADRWAGITALSGTLSRGLDVLGASQAGDDDLSREAGSGTFTAVAAEASRLQPLRGAWSLFASLKGQYAFDSLLVSEAFDFGGEAYGRAYDSSELTGDHGLAARLELRYGRLTGLPWLLSAQPFLSADIGAIWNRDSDESGVDSSADAASVSLGLRFDLTRRISGSVEVAQPLTRSPTIDRDDGKKMPRGFFRLNAAF